MNEHWHLIQTANAVVVMKRDIETDEDFVAFLNMARVRGIELIEV